MTKIPETYRQLAWKLLGTLLKGYGPVDLVADTYQVSINNCELLKCGTSLRIMINSPTSKVPGDFTKFIKCGENKTRRINFICEVISSDYKRALTLLKCNEINFSKEDNYLLFNESVTHKAVCLKFNQEQAGTKIILHCLDGLNDLEATIVIRSPSADTDVMVIVTSE